MRQFARERCEIRAATVRERFTASVCRLSLLDGRDSVVAARLSGLACGVAIVLTGSVAGAGMPAPLPSDFETVSRLTDSAHGRVQAISFFMFGILLSAFLIQLLWNAVRRDFPKLPRLRFLTALAGTLLWGLLFVIVLTMVAGARELMTPGAWEKQGMTYRLAGSNGKQTATEEPDLRRDRLDQLNAALLRYASQHEGRYPEQIEDGVAGELLDVPGNAGLRYVYVPGLTVRDADRVLLYEPEIDHDRRHVLTAGGKVRSITTGELQKSLGKVVSE